MLPKDNWATVTLRMNNWTIPNWVDMLLWLFDLQYTVRLTVLESVTNRSSHINYAVRSVQSVPNLELDHRISH